MKNKISFGYGYHDKNNSEWVIDSYRGILLKHAEEDYIASRILLILDRQDNGFYHIQQCIEKYLKAFVLDRNIEIISGRKNICSDFKKNGHKLEYWAKICGKVDEFFNDKDFIIDLTIISEFEEIFRYPQDRIQSRSGSPKTLLKFLDEFVWEMRNRIEHLQYQDIILAFANGYTNSDPRLFTKYKYNLTPKQIQEFLTIENDYYRI